MSGSPADSTPPQANPTLPQANPTLPQANPTLPKATKPPTSGTAVAPGTVADVAVPVLLVDDNAAKLLAVKSALAPLGYRIHTAESGVAALRCVAAQDFAVILLDVRMPAMDGFETAALIRMRKESEMTPIIFVTSHTKGEFTPSDLYSQGAADFISAPIQADELRAKVALFANHYLKARELALAAQRVQASADQLRLLTEAAPIGIFQTDADNRYIHTNPRWSEITGMSARVAAGQQWDVIIRADQRFASLVDTSGHSADGSEISHRFELKTAGSAPKVVLLNSRSILDAAGNVTGWVGTLADVTAVAHAQSALSDARDEAASASKLKSDFLANMSHEIRTPMNGVLGMVELLLETDLDVSQRDYAETISQSGEALLTVINDILDFSKIETGKFELENVQYNLVTVVDGVADLLSGMAGEKRLLLDTTFSDSVPALVNGDPGRVRQVLTNLVGNAIKFSQSGTISIRVDVTGSGPGAVVRFDVCDTGMGIASDQLATIFEPFIQADMSTTRISGGTGLGLAISYQLVTLMGGDIGVSSEPGVGSTFWFTLVVPDPPETKTPDDDSAAVQPVPPASSADHQQRTDELATGRLLLAEDNLVNQKVALAMLRRAGYEVDVVVNGTDAVRAATERSYDAILMDCRMPELSGYEATAAIRAHEGMTRHTPIVALTAGARGEDRERCLAAGMDDYLSKPINKGSLLEMVRISLEAAPAPPA